MSKTALDVFGEKVGLTRFMLMGNIQRQEIEEAMNAYADQRVSEALNSQWVSVKERLPQQGSMVWFIHSGDFLHHGFFRSGYQENVLNLWFEICKKTDFEIPLSKVSHWQYVFIPKKPSPPLNH